MGTIQSMPQRAVLRPRHIDFLQALADGLNMMEIGEDFGFSHLYVKQQMVAVREILGADTTAQAVAMALRRGLIQ